LQRDAFYGQNTWIFIIACTFSKLNQTSRAARRRRRRLIILPAWLRYLPLLMMREREEQKEKCDDDDNDEKPNISRMGYCGYVRESRSQLLQHPYTEKQLLY